MFAAASEGQKRALDPMELELEGHPVSTETLIGSSARSLGYLSIISIFNEKLEVHKG